MALNSSRACFVGGLFLVLGQIAFAQGKGPIQGPIAPEPAPTFELDKKGQKAHLDFSLAFQPISDASLRFQNFAKRKLVIFYFSAKCSHCLHAAPYVQKVSDELAAKGFASIAIAVKYNTGDDIRTFIRDYKIHMPMFHDDTRLFGENYGTGSIPLVFLVNEKGEYIRYKTFDAEQTPAMMKTQAHQFAAK